MYDDDRRFLEEFDLEYWFERESRPYKLSRGSSGLQIHVQECPNPVCLDRRWRTYLNAETGIGNCLAGDTEILTREFGSIAIEKVAGKTVTLLDGNGDWVSCVIYDHGMQETVATKFEGFRGSVTVRSTPDHGWIRMEGGVILTRDFTTNANKQEIADLRPRRSVCDEQVYADGVAHGLIYGDGSKEKTGNYRIRLCSHHESLSPWLSRFKSSPVRGGDPRFYIPRRDAWCEFKEFPVDPGRSLDYLLGFLRGWFAADGCVSEQPNATLCCGPDEHEWLKIWGPLVGWHTIKATKLALRTNFGDRIKESLNVGLRTQMMSADDFLIERHRERWLANPFIDAFRKVWRITKKPADCRMERVYCPFVPTTNSFALTSGIHSRNCFVCNMGYNKAKFIHLALGHDPDDRRAWAETFKHMREVATERGWRPPKKAIVAVDYGEAKLPLSIPLPTKDGQHLIYLQNRGIGPEIAKYFHLRYCEIGGWEFPREDGTRGRQDFSGRVIIPVFDLNGKLKTFQGRDVTGTAGDKKYLFPKGLPGTGRFLLNGQSALRAKRAAMGEGAFDVAAMKIAFDGENALRDVIPIGSFGKHLSFGTPDGNDQFARLRILHKAGLEELTIMWDGEWKALIAAIDAAEVIQSIGIKVKIALLPADRDPNEITAAEVRRAFWEARPYTKALAVRWRLRNPFESSKSKMTAAES